jgi:large subunit ribosomal protein L1
MFRGKKYRAAAEKIDHDKAYELAEAVKLVKETSTTKFDGSIEIHVGLGVDPKHADQQVRGTVNLPHGTGKTKRVVAFVPEDKVKEAKDAGALEAGAEDLIEKVKKGWTDFDITIATPDMMRHLGKLGKVLGTKGLMPNPKAGTVTTEVGKTIKEIAGGRIEFRTDASAIVHNVVGKASFDENQLIENIKALLAALRAAKPTELKGIYMKSVSLASSMGPGIKVDVESTK